jgi:hypothetical protein
VRRLAAAIAALVVSAGCGGAIVPVTTVDVGEWTATCGLVEPTVCSDVAALAINNLARTRPSGTIEVVDRPACPVVPQWADGSHCWRVRIPAGDSEVCMVIARQRVQEGYVQVAGDVPGLALGGGDHSACL